MKILFFGGNRYFGRTILNLLSRNKKNLIYLVNRSNKKNFLKKNIKLLKVDRTNFNDLKKKISGMQFDVVFDNIAYKKKDVNNLFKILKNNYKKYIFSSTVLAGNINSVSVKRNYTSDEIKYGKNKKKIEDFLKKTKKKYLILRIHSVLGKKDFSKKTFDLLNSKDEDLKKFKIKKKEKIQFVYENDLSKIIAYLIENYRKFTFKTINIANDHTTIEKILKNSIQVKKNNVILRKRYPFPVNLIINNNKIKKIMPEKLKNINKILSEINS